MLNDYFFADCQTFLFHYLKRWNNLKMKVNQAKQRLGPRIQAEAASVTEVTVWYLLRFILNLTTNVASKAVENNET